MTVFDLHADTATVMYDHRKLLTDPSLHLHADGLSRFASYTQCFAVFTDNSGRAHGMEYFREVRRYLLEQTAAVKNLHPVLTIEGGDVIGGDPGRLAELKDAGVKIFGLVWNGENELACGAYMNDRKGLTEKGKETARELERLRILPDVSHLSEAGFWDLARGTEGPLTATHSDARSVHPDLRNLTDEQIRLIRDRHGLIGLNFYPEFLAEGTATVDDLLRHADRILSLGGEDILVLGSDFDGVDALPEGIRGVEDMATVAGRFREEYGTTLAEKILHGNAERLLA